MKFSFLSENGTQETEEYEIEMRDFPQCFKSGRQDSFRAKLRNIGKPQQIRLILEIQGDDDNEHDIKWELDHVTINFE